MLFQYQLKITDRLWNTGPSPSNVWANDGCSEVSSPSNLAWRFLDACCRHRHSIALSTVSSVDLTYEQLKAECVSLSQRIKQLPGFRRGMHVGLHFENSIEYVVAFYGTILAGAVVVPIPFAVSKTRRIELCELACVEILLTAGEQQKVIEIGSPINVKDKPLQEYVGPDCLAMLMFTSGSTGASKAVMLTHRNLTANCDSIRGFLPIERTDRALAISPFTHALGNSVLQTHILGGSELFLPPPKTGLSDVLALVTDFNCNSLTAVPDVLVNLSKSISSKQVTSIKYIACAGGRLSPDVALRIDQQLGGDKLYLMYGQTEATARLAWLPPNALTENPNSIGQAVPGVQLKIVDDGGNEVGDEVVGNLMATGPNITRGYFSDFKGTLQILDNGWLNTGDLAKKKTNGFFEICGRKSGLVKILGHRFHPLEIENLVGSVLDDTQVVVTPFDFYGNTRIALFARSISGQVVSKTELKSICRKLLPVHMMPQRIQIVENWPLNNSGKVNRNRLAKKVETRSNGI